MTDGRSSAAAKIGRRTIAEIPSGLTREFRLRDTALPGFCVRAYPSGRRVYAVTFKRGGSRSWFKIGTVDAMAPDAARREAQQLLAGIARGEFPRSVHTRKKERLTVADIIARYLEEGPIDRPAKRASSWANDRSYLRNHALAPLGRVRLDELTPARLARWQADVAAGRTAKKKGTGRGRSVTGGNGAATHAMRSLSGAFGWAVERELIPDNPARKVRKLQDGARERYLTRAEAQRLFATIERQTTEATITQTQADVVRLLALTAARATEIMRLEWSEVDFPRRLLRLPPTRHKTGGTNRPKSIPTPSAALAILLGRTGNGSRYVFPCDRDRDEPVRTVKHSWAKITKEAELEDLRLHGLRHSYASFAVEQGVPMQVVGKNLGHAKTSTTERYAHLRDEAGLAVAEGVSALYAASMN